MSEHRGNQIADYLAGLLTETARRDFEEHMRSCAECSADVSWARELREEALRQGLRHLSSARIVEVGGNRPSLTGAEKDHLAHCAQCGKDIDWAESLAAPDSGKEEDGWTTKPPMSTSGVPQRLKWGTGLAAAAALLLFVFVPRGGDPNFADFAQVEPLPVRITRSSPELDSFEERRLLALEVYAAGDYVTAGSHLNDALVLRPEDSEVLLYLGSTLLLRGQPESAADRFRPATTATDPALRDEATWQLANAFLLANRGEEAARLLEILVSREGRRRSDAQDLVNLLGSD